MAEYDTSASAASPDGHANRRLDAYVEIGSTGLNITGGLVQDEFLRELRSDRAIKVYREMSDNDPIVGGMLFGIEMLVRKIDWPVTPHDDDPDDAQGYAQFIEEAMHDMAHSWEDFISQVMSFLPFGWAYHEIVYKKRNGENDDDSEMGSKFEDGKTGWAKLPIRAQDTLLRWEVDEEKGNKLIGMIQSAPPKYTPVCIPVAKALHFRTSALKDNPQGRSVLRNAYRPWFFKRFIEEVEGIGVERDLAGMPVAWIPAEWMGPNASPEQTAAAGEFKEMVRRLKRNEQEGLVWPLAYDESGNKLFDITLLSTAGTRQFDTDKIVARYDQRIAMTLLEDFMLLGHEAVGSKALGVSKMEMFTSAIESWVKMIASEFNTQAIPRLMKLNGMDTKLRPQVTPGRVDHVDLAELADYVQKLALAGAPMFPNPEMEKYLLEVAGLPMPETVTQSDS